MDAKEEKIDILSWVEKSLYSKEFSLFQPMHPALNLSDFLAKDSVPVLNYYQTKHPQLILVTNSEISEFIRTMFLKKMDTKSRVACLDFLTQHSDFISPEEYPTIHLVFLHWLVRVSGLWTEKDEAYKQDILLLREKYNNLFDKLKINPLSKHYKKELIPNDELTPYDLDGVLRPSAIVLIGLSEDQQQTVIKKHPDINKIPYSSLSASNQKRWFSFLYQKDPLEALGDLIKPLAKLLTEDNHFEEKNENSFNFALFDLVYVLKNSGIEYDQQVLVNEIKKIEASEWRSLNSQAWTEPQMKDVVAKLVNKLSSFYGLSRLIKLLISSMQMNIIELGDTLNMMEVYFEMLQQTKTVPAKPKNLKEIHDFLSKLPKQVGSNQRIYQKWMGKLEGVKVAEYSIHFLEYEAEFILAGSALGICVGVIDYRNKTISGRSQIFVLKDNQGEVRYCVEYSRESDIHSFLDNTFTYDLKKNYNWYFRQAKGFSNELMPAPLLALVQKKVSELIKDSVEPAESSLNPMSLISIAFDVEPMLKQIALYLTAFAILIIGSFITFLVMQNNKEQADTKIVMTEGYQVEQSLNKLNFELGISALAYTRGAENCFSIAGKYPAIDGFFLTSIDGVYQSSKQWDERDRLKFEHTYCTPVTSKEVLVELFNMNSEKMMQVKFTRKK